MLHWISKIRQTDSSASSRYIKWCNDFSEKAKRLESLMRDKKDQGLVKLDGEIYKSIADLEEHLKIFEDEIPQVVKNKESHITLLLLKFVQVLVGHLSNTQYPKKDLCTVLNLVTLVTTRPEFDFNISSSSIQFYKKKYNLYRMTLSELYMFVTTKLEELTHIEHYNSFVLINPHYVAYARILVVLYFRLPFVGDLIRTSIALADEPKPRNIRKRNKYCDLDLFGDTDRLSKSQYLLKNTKKILSQGDDKQKGQQELYKKLSSFSKRKIDMLNEIISELASSKEIQHNTSQEPQEIECWRVFQNLLSPEDRCFITKRSLLWLVYVKEGESVLFVLLLKEWILYLKKHIFNDPYNIKTYQWKNIKGYLEMEDTFLSLFQRAKPTKLSDPMLTCSSLLLTCNVELINVYIIYTFKNTNVHDFRQVTDTLNKLSYWFKEIEKSNQFLPVTFDSDFFCKGLDIIIENDRCHLISQVISTLYAYSHLFVGEVRTKVLMDFFLAKHFFKLFLHWNALVRSHYHYWLIYKIVRINRADLSNNEFEKNITSKDLILDEHGCFVKCPDEELALDIKMYNIMLAYVRMVADNSIEQDAENFNRNMISYAKISYEDYNKKLTENHRPAYIDISDEHGPATSEV